MDCTQILDFLRQYTALQCSCCSSVYGFQHKATGTMYCLGGCVERFPPSATSMVHSPNPMETTIDLNPLAGLMSRSTLTTTISSGIHGTGGGSVPNTTPQVDLQPTEAVHPISAPMAVASPPVKLQKVSSVQQSNPATEMARVAPSQPMNIPVTAEVQAGPSQPKQITSNVNVPAAVISRTNVIQRSEDVPDARIKEPKPAPPVVVSVKPNPNVSLSRANIPWPEYGSSESLECNIAFDCGDGGLFLQSSAPVAMDSIVCVGEAIVGFLRSGKCKPLEKPAVGDLCLAPFEGDHYRAEIIAEDVAGKWRVFFVDFGNFEILKSVDLLIIPDVLKTQPRLCTFGYWDQVLARQKRPEELYKICNTELESPLVTFLQKITDGQYVVQIGEAAKATFEVERPSSIPVPVPVKPPHLWEDCFFSEHLLRMEPVVHIIHGYDIRTYHVMADADEETIIKFQTFIAKYASVSEPLTRPPCVGEIVVAPYDGAYYRGKVDKVEGDNCVCSFVDYGDRKVIKISDIKSVNDDIMKFPIYGMVIRLAKIPTPPEGFTINDELDQTIYSPSYALELKKPGDAKPAELPYFDAKCWNLDGKHMLNEDIKAAIAAYK